MFFCSSGTAQLLFSQVLTPNKGSRNPQIKSHKTKIKTKVRMVFKSMILLFIFLGCRGDSSEESALSRARLVSVSADRANDLVAVSFQLAKMAKGAILSFGENLNRAPWILRADFKFRLPDRADRRRANRCGFFLTTHTGNLFAHTFFSLHGRFFQSQCFLHSLAIHLSITTVMPF